MATIQVAGAFEVAAGQNLTFVDEMPFSISSSGGPVTLRISGSVNATVPFEESTSPIGSYGVYASTGNYVNGKIVIESGGLFRIVGLSTWTNVIGSTQGYVYGVAGFYGAPDFINHGRFEVLGAKSAFGVINNVGGHNQRGYVIENSGVIRVEAPEAATAIAPDYGGSFHNTGVIEAVSTNALSAACGVNLGSRGQNIFVNDGQIIARGGTSPEGGGPAVFFGVPFAPPSLPASAWVSTFINNGLIEGRYALFGRAVVHGAAHEQLFVNNGVMRGEVVLGQGQSELRNAGSIVGAVSLSESNDTYDGRGGSVIGDVSGYLGADSLAGGSGAERLFGGAGDDTITDQGGSNYLRGEDGNDSIAGGAGFDDINGNMGDDRAQGGDGADWVVGGKDQDQLFGGNGDDIVYGNLGRDTCEGGDGADIVRGGQDNDVLTGGAGDDWLSGDRGDDTVSGGGGGDVFHTFSEAGLDRVTDFNRAEGDRVMVDPGVTYTVSQVGSDVVVDMGGGNQLVLVGVALSSLTGAWIFGS